MKRKHEDTDFNSSDDEALLEIVNKLDYSNLKLVNAYKCAICDKEFKHKFHLNRHRLSHSLVVKCRTCGNTFTRYDSLKRHERNKHAATIQRETVEARQFNCVHCDVVFQNYASLFDHVRERHPINQTGGRGRATSTTRTGTNQVSEHVTNAAESGEPNVESALTNGVQNRIIYPENEGKYDLLAFFANVRSQIRDILQSRVRDTGGIKWNLCTHVEMERQVGDGETQSAIPYFRSRTYSTLTVETFSDHELNDALQKMQISLENYIRQGSAWNVKRVIHMEIQTVVYTPILGKSYIELPGTLKRSSGILNITNTDNKCFIWCVLASIHPSHDSPESVVNYEPFECELSMGGIGYPVTLSKIDRFERQNCNISVNVFSFEKNEILPLKITKNSGRVHHVNLLLIKTSNSSHYCLIKDLNKFLSRTKSHKSKHFFCNYCLHGFTTERILLDHIPYCSTNGPQKVQLPKPGKDDILEFKDFAKQLKCPFVIYADTETFNRKIQSCAPNPEHSSTTPKTLMEICGYGYKVVCEDEKYTKPTVIYRGTDASKNLIESLIKEKDEIKDMLKRIEPIQMTEENEDHFSTCHRCCICHKSFGSSEQKCRHHNHLTGKYIGPAHMNCNLQCKQADYIPVLFHGLRNFDGHLLCQSIGYFKDTEIKCIPQNLERYISFSLGDLRFIDSFQFLNSSLECLVNNLAVDGIIAFRHLQSEFPVPEHANMLLRKGIYPYDYIDTEEKFNEPHLPPREEFYSHLKRETVSETDYEHAHNVFETFRHKTLGDYHDLYLKSDVVLLCDVFEQFRNVCMEQYELDPCHFYSSPGLSWAACLKMTGVTLELMTDIDQILFIEKGIRGGISQISNRYKCANNPLLENYDPNVVTSYNMYYDANNLYGWAMCQPLPHSGFRFLDTEEVQDFDVKSVGQESDFGYILEVTLSYPEHLHNMHNEYPLAPERKLFTDDMLSPYAKRIWNKLHGKTEEDDLHPRGKVEKLALTLEPKHNYVVHYRNLQLYLQLGMEVKQVHRILEFYQRPWMEKYISFNTEMRKKATSTFQKNFYKLMNCSVFGKVSYLLIIFNSENEYHH
ncbi:MAG: C2H2-type zinc finger protein [Sedimenticola sp.]